MKINDLRDELIEYEVWLLYNDDRIKNLGISERVQLYLEDMK